MYGGNNTWWGIVTCYPGGYWREELLNVGADWNLMISQR